MEQQQPSTTKMYSNNSNIDDNQERFRLNSEFSEDDNRKF